MLQLEKPILIFSIGRSGSTIFHQMVSWHRRVSYLSYLCNKYPHRPEYNAYLMSLINLPWLGPLIRSKLHPVEVYSFFDTYYPGFSRPCRDLTAADLTHYSRDRLRRALSQAVSESRPRLMIKITGWPRIGFLKELFPNALFVHLVRDGRAVINSFLKRDFWQGWGGPPKWRWGELGLEDREIWLQSGRSFVALAAIQWNVYLNAVEESRDLAGKDYYQLRYEDLCAKPYQELERLCSFLELEWEPRFFRKIQVFDLHNANDKWNQDLTEAQIRIAQDLMEHNLHKLGYL